MIQPVTTGQIYWGAVPFVCIQVIMVGLAIGVPEMIMHYKSGASTVDPSTIEITIPPTGGGDGNGLGGTPDFGTPPDLGQPPDTSQPPDLSQPPTFD